MIEELVSRSFNVRNVAQLTHWRAKGAGSYARHMALGSFYDDIIDKLDSIVEAYQGMTGKAVAMVKLDGRDTQREILPMLQSECEWIAENRSEIAEDNAAIENMLDDLCALYLGTIYKLKFLS